MALKWYVSRINKTSLEDSLSNVCKEIEWVVSEDDPAIKENYEAYKLGVVTLNSAKSDSFIPFESLTLDECVLCVKNVLGSSEVTAIETDVNNQISEQKAGTITTGLPWSY